MTRSLRAAAVVMAVLVAGCARKLVLPAAPSQVTLAGKTATFRDWSKSGDLCLMEQDVFGADLDSMNVLLLEVLGQTSAGVDGVWSDENVALLEQAQRDLPAPLELTQQGVYRAERSSCRFEGLAKTNELLAMTRRRLADAPELVLMVKAKLALLKWKNSQPMVLETAREAACPPLGTFKKHVGSTSQPVLFYAFEDERGRVEWLFCDGKKVFASPGNLPALDPGGQPEPPKRASPQAYLDVAAKLPGTQVNRAPKLPMKRVVRNEDPEPGLDP